jgi:hypothetical protein
MTNLSPPVHHRNPTYRHLSNFVINADAHPTDEYNSLAGEWLQNLLAPAISFVNVWRRAYAPSESAG